MTENPDVLASKEQKTKINSDISKLVKLSDALNSILDISDSSSLYQLIDALKLKIVEIETQINTVKALKSKYGTKLE
ncbi:hypothetical protein ACJA23_01285 [Mycoplasma corogypsi]|uniref:hypothetical protein n=1 Tax=Mycoplasma corogypsi TaxID=2106 RepID=UPI0038731845